MQIVTSRLAMFVTIAVASMQPTIGLFQFHKRDTTAVGSTDKTRILLINSSRLIADGDTLTISQTFHVNGDRFAPELLASPGYSDTLPTILYIHGYIETPQDESVRTVVDAYARRSDHNVLVLDWSELAGGNYLLEAVSNMRALAGRLTDVLLWAKAGGFPVDKLHVVGHSLGGQMAGLVGRQLYERSNGSLTLRRISALDPANPPFYFDGTHLRSSDARSVDVIHTDAALFGAPVASGTADFWPNGGMTLQPGCEWRNWLQPLSKKSLCSHHRSWRFWAESLDDPRGFPARRSSNWPDFLRRNRIENLVGRHEEDVDVEFMGIDCRPKASGNFYLQTNNRQPFARRVTGLRYTGRS